MMPQNEINVYNFTKEDCARYTNKGRTWYMEFLFRFAKQEEAFSSDPETKKELFRILAKFYKKRMYTDKEFFTKVVSFVSQRHMTSEKDEFFKRVTKEIKDNYDVKAEFFRRYQERNEDFDTAVKRRKKSHAKKKENIRT